MAVLRRITGDVLRRRRQAQSKTLREVSGEARVSLGYLSEVERGRKEASSELLASICDALGVPLWDVLREVSDDLERSERVAAALPLEVGPGALGARLGADGLAGARRGTRGPSPAGAVERPARTGGPRVALTGRPGGPSRPAGRAGTGPAAGLRRGGTPPGTGDAVVAAA